MKQEQWKLSYKGRAYGEAMNRELAEKKLIMLRGVVLGLELEQVEVEE